jgi:Helix-turn-helix domain
MSLGTEEPRVFIHPDGRMNRKNAAIYLGCSPKTLADWATKGSGPPYVFVGGRAFYFREALDGWIKAQMASPSSSRPRLICPKGDPTKRSDLAARAGR